MVSISGTIREAGKGISSQRREGLVPGVLYGPNVESVSVSVEAKAFASTYEEAGESTLVEMELNGAKRLVLIHEIQRDPLSGVPLHVDFYEPALDRTVEVDVELVFDGEAPAAKDLGGTFVPLLQEVRVEALPQRLPHDIHVPISGLKTFDDRITIADLPALEGVEYLHEQDEAVAHVEPPEDVDAQLEVPVEENVEAVEQVERGKKEEEDKDEES